MRTKNITKHLILGALILTTGNVVGQATVPGNVANAPTDFLGWDATGTNNFPLQVRHDGPHPIDFWTSGDFRARINPRVTYGLLNTFPNIVADGFTLITPDGSFLSQPPRGPFSRLHLAETAHMGGNAEQFGYRPWQRNGITFTGNGDQGYVGQKYNADNETDMVIQWSDNPEVERADRLRFIFTSSYDQGAGEGMNSEEGLEGMRLWPTWEEGIKVGVGDFFADGSDPTERLHILDGRVRIEQLPDDPKAEELTKFMVVDDTDPNSDEYGVVKWRYLPTPPPPALSCDWTLNPTTHNNVSTAFGLLDPDCPDEGDAVGIGVNLGGGVAPAKLNVETDDFNTAVGITSTRVGLFNTGVNLLVTGATGENHGLDIDCHGGASKNFGVYVETDGASYSANAGYFASNDDAAYTAGVRGEAYMGTNECMGVLGRTYSNGTNNYGVRGEAVTSPVTGGANHYYYGVNGVVQNVGPSQIAYGVRGRVLNVASGQQAYGVYGEAQPATNSWAGWFQGNVLINGNGFLTGMIPIVSDASLKTSVQDLDGANTILQQLQPRTYEFLVDEHPELALQSGPQMGFIAQEVEQVLPQMVKQITVPATYDSTGAQLTASEEIKTLNYIGLIPLLVAGMQEQQATIAQLQAQIDQCCAANPGMAPQNGAAPVQGTLQGTLQEQRLVIQPNPFTDHTTLGYYVPKAGKVSLQISTSDGKPLGTLREEQAEAGSYTYEWNTSKLASGTYFCTYMLDGAVVVKRAVKVAR